MKRHLLSILIVCVTLTPRLCAQDVPVNYGPEWESIKQSYKQITDKFTQNRSQILNNRLLSAPEQHRLIQAQHNQFVAESQKLAARRGQIIKVAADRSGLAYTLGSDPATGRGMAGDIDLGGTPQQARKFMQELKNLGISDVFDESSITRKPGYVSVKVPMDVTVNYEGPLGKVGSSAHQTQIWTDARSKETYLSVAMEGSQPGRKAVETLDHIRKARQGLKTPPSMMLDAPEALQVACKGTFKAMEVTRITDPEMRVILKKAGLNMTPDQFLNTLEKIRKGTNIAPELAGVTKENIRGVCNALDETTRACQNKAVQSFETDMRRARGVEATLRNSNDPAIRSQIPGAKATLIDSTVRMRENLRALIEMDEAGNSALRNRGEVAGHNKKMKLWMDGIEAGVSKKPVGPMIFGETKQFRLPGAETLDDVVSRGIKGYQNFRHNARVNAVAGRGMQVAGGIMIAASWYNSGKAAGDSDWWAGTKAVGAGFASLTRIGSLAMGASDLNYHMTVKAENYGKDQAWRYALMGLDAKHQDVNDLIHTRVLVRKGVYGVVKTTSYGSIFLAHPALIVTGAALEAGLAVYEAYEEATLWELYAEKVSELNDAQTRGLFQRGGYVATRIAGNLNAHADWLHNAVQSYHELIKEKDRIVEMRKNFAKDNAAYHAYLQGLSKTLNAAQDPQAIGADQAQALLTTLKQVEGQAVHCSAQVAQAAGTVSQNPDAIDGAHSVLMAMTSEYQALTLQLDMTRPNVMQLTAQGQVAPMESPVASLKAYQQQMAALEAMLTSRYDAVGALMSNSLSIGRQIQALSKRRNEFLGLKIEYGRVVETKQGNIVQYIAYLSRQPGPDAADALARARAALAAVKAIEVPVWKNEYVDALQNHYLQIREALKQVQASGRLVSTLYPEPITSLYKNIEPQTVALSPQISQQWQKSGAAMARFHAALSSLRALVGSIVPLEDEALEDEQDEETEYRDWDPSELRQELARLRALQAELRKRCDTHIADLNKAYFADRDALWKAYEAAFKTPKILPCENCKTKTMHSMDYSDNPPSVWCNSCGRILSFMRWAGGGQSLADIRSRGQAKKAAIQSQLETNLRAVDMAIDQVNAAMRGE